MHCIQWNHCHRGKYRVSQKTSDFIKGWHFGQEASSHLKFLHDLENCLNVLQKNQLSTTFGRQYFAYIFGENRLKYEVSSKNGQKILSVHDISASTFAANVHIKLPGMWFLKWVPTAEDCFRQHSNYKFGYLNLIVSLVQCLSSLNICKYVNCPEFLKN